MKNLSYLKIIIALSICSFYACAPIYFPNTTNTPLLSKRHDTRLAVYASPSFGMAYDAQAAYAVSNHIGLMFNGSYMNKNKDRYGIFTRNYLLEGGIGYFKATGDQRIEVYTGYGVGQNDSYYHDNTSVYFQTGLNKQGGRITADLQRFFLQTNYGYVSKYAEVAASLRYVFVNINEFYSDNTTQGHFIEPAFTVKVGMENLKFVAKGGLSIGKFTSESTYDHNPLILSVGLEGSIGARQKTPSTTPPVSY